jgi:hypothetical protein
MNHGNKTKEFQSIKEILSDKQSDCCGKELKTSPGMILSSERVYKPLREHLQPLEPPYNPEIFMKYALTVECTQCGKQSDKGVAFSVDPTWYESLRTNTRLWLERRLLDCAKKFNPIVFVNRLFCYHHRTVGDKCFDCGKWKINS